MEMELRKNISMNNNTVKRLDDRIENIGVRMESAASCEGPMFIIPKYF
jgi:hypothetical protein